MSSEPLRWRAPKSLRVGSFFNDYDARDWGNLAAYFKSSKNHESFQEYYDAYHQHLSLIAASELATKPVKEHAHDLLDRVTLSSMEEAYDEYVLHKLRCKTTQSIQKGMLTLNREAGEEIAKGTKISPVLPRQAPRVPAAVAVTPAAESTPTSEAATPTAATPTASSPSASKKRRTVYATEEPWHSLTITLTKIVNGEKIENFPAPSPTMIPVHAQLFDHAVNSLSEYQAQSAQEKDIVLVKDAQVAMSCLLNTMSSGACQHFEEAGDKDVLYKAKSYSIIADFEDHPSTRYLRNYIGVLKGKGLNYLRNTLIVDRGILRSQHMHEERLPVDVEIEDKTIQILALLCDFVLHPPFGNAPPSENDCLHIWVSIFGIIKDKVSIHTGEKVLEASKIMRQMQAAEYSDVCDAGRKVDCIFMFDGIELSNIEFKNPDIGARDLAIQNRKNVRLARCIQEAHMALSVQDASILMADISGFVGVFYQVRPMGEISIAGKTTPTFVLLPRTAGGLETFLEGNSLAIIWNYISRLEQQGRVVARAKERYDVEQEKARFAKGLAMTRGSTPPTATVERQFQHNVTMSPSRKRTWANNSA